MVKKIFILTLPIVFFSCKKQSELESIISNDTKKWAFYTDKTKIEQGIPLLQYNVFNKDGNSTEYLVREYRKEVLKKGKWNYSKKDNILNVFGVKLKVLKFEEDTIFLKLENKNIYPLLINKKE